MSPTLLELVVTVFVLVLAWLIGAWIAPRLIAWIVVFWRGPRLPGRGVAPTNVPSPSDHARLLPPK